MPIPYRILSDDTLNLLAARGDAQALMELGYRAERLGILAEARELANRLREGEEMSNCKHCDHLTARWEDTAGEHKRWQCCHCGRIRGEYAPSYRGFGDVWETGGHGPFLPPPRFAESKTGNPLNARDPDHDCAAPDCLDDQDVPAFLRPQAG